MEALQASTGPPAALANPPPVGRVTPCAPRLPPAGTGYTQRPLANPVAQMAIPQVHPPEPCFPDSLFPPSNLVTPSPTKTTNFAPIRFDHAPARPDVYPLCSARREECRATGLPRGSRRQEAQTPSFSAYGTCRLPSAHFRGWALNVECFPPSKIATR